MIESQMNLAIPASSGSANLYFKAANADLPAE
jgi:hypothetical protein